VKDKIGCLCHKGAKPLRKLFVLCEDVVDGKMRKAILLKIIKTITTGCGICAFFYGLIFTFRCIPGALRFVANATISRYLITLISKFVIRWRTSK
jgi:hypothetical protein